MEHKEIDAVTGRDTTGHEWNGIKELDTPVPRGILLFVVVTHVWAIALWFLLPSWPLGTTYTKGLLEADQRTSVEQSLVQGANERADWTQRISSDPYDAILADAGLMARVRRVGPQLFGDNCAACHGRDGQGRTNYPNLADNDWLWGGSPEAIERTLRVGINSQHPESRIGQMPAFGRDAMLERRQVEDVSSFVYSLSHPDFVTAKTADQIDAGRGVFAENCASCHGENAQGNQEMGAPNLTDAYWIYGGDLRTIIKAVQGGREGHMPTWEGRLTAAEIRTLTLYVLDLSRPRP